MSVLVICAALVAGGGFSVDSIDGGNRVVLTTTRSEQELKDVRCRWTLLKDALPAASGQWALDGLRAGRPLTNSVPRAYNTFKERGGDFALRVRFVTGETDPDEETLLAVSQIDFPRVKPRPLPVYVGEPAVLSETAGTYEFKTSSTRIRFDRASGLLSGFATGWWSQTEWLKRPMAFDFGDSAPRVRMESFSKPSETNGVWTFRTVSWWTLGEGRQECRPNVGTASCRPNVGTASCRTGRENFEIRVSTDWAVRGDGRVVSETVIRPFGIRRQVPRIGWAFVLAPPELLVQYYGAGPSRDAPENDPRVPGPLFAGLTGLYSSSVAGCGAHAETRGVSFDAGSDHLAFSTLGDNFYLEVGATPSKAAFCGLVVARDAVTDRDWKIDLLISPEKTLQALSLAGAAGAK